MSILKTWDELIAEPETFSLSRQTDFVKIGLKKSGTVDYGQKINTIRYGKEKK